MPTPAEKRAASLQAMAAAGADAAAAAAAAAKAAAVPALPAAKSGPPVSDVVPAKRARLDESAGLTAAAAPVEPSPEPSFRVPPSDAHVNAVPVLKHLIPQIRSRLQRALALDAEAAAAGPVHEYAPLSIQEKTLPGGVASYKSPWNKGECGVAIRSTELYEAGCNVTWLNPGVGDGSAPAVSWSFMCELTDLLFSVDSQS